MTNVVGLPTLIYAEETSVALFHRGTTYVGLMYGNSWRFLTAEGEDLSLGPTYNALRLAAEKYAGAVRRDARVRQHQQAFQNFMAKIPK